MKINMNRFKWLRGLGNASYIIGVAFLITSLFVNAFPPQAAEASPLKCILGCTDPSAINYNPRAEKDDGSCTYVVGCTDKHATNYNKDATKDDGTCTYDILGCTDKNAINYNKDATKDDGTCIYDILGCTDKNAVNYNKDATKDDGTCTYDILGCMDKNAINYNKDATKDDGTCTYDILGCTDKNATNYNKDATKDDGTCIFPPPDYKLNLSHIACVDGKVEIHFVLLNVPDGITPGTLTYTYGTISPSRDTGNVWHYSDYKPDGYFNVTTASVDVGGITVNLHNPGEDAGNYLCSHLIPGCTDPKATNNNSEATVDDGSCEYTPIPGCIDPEADNYNLYATEDDGSCTYSGCTDVNATNYDPRATLEDGSCEYPPPCEWNPALLAEDSACKPNVSFGSCYNPIKGLFELKVVNKGVVGYYIGYDVYGESGIYNLGYFSTGESKSFDVPLLNGNNDTLRKYASLTGQEPWTQAGGTHVFDPSTENVCEYDPARVEVSCNPHAEQKLTWTIHNDNHYPVDYFWTWSILSEPGGMGNISALSSGSFTTDFKPATMQIRLGSLQFYIEPEDCNIPPKDKTPTQSPRITPTVKVKTVAPPVVTPQILIPVTGVDLGSGGNQQMTLLNLGLAFLGLGLVLNGFARARKEWDI
jgi:hypothetical protein